MGSNSLYAANANVIYMGLMTVLATLALGLVYTSTLNRRLIIGVFVVGWLGLLPYGYEWIASETNPPMNWSVASERSGFYYSITRLQYPKSLPNLIKETFGKALGVTDPDAQIDSTLDLPGYVPRLAKTFYYYGYDLQDNFTVPLIFLTLALLLYFQRCDRAQINWFIFLAAAFFLLGFLLQLIAPQEGFDFERNDQYKVFHLQSHCIFVLLVGYGALGAMLFIYDTVRDVVPAGLAAVRIGAPTVFLALLPLWSNFDDCNQAGHWFGYKFGADSMRSMDRNAIYLGGTDPGRFVPTYFAFVESQQPDRWKREPGFDRRDVAVITQNALCDAFYNKYIRNQYDDRFRPQRSAYTPFEKALGRDNAYPRLSLACFSDEEYIACWDEYRQRPGVAERIKKYGINAMIRQGSNDVFEVNGVFSQKFFEKNKATRTFYLEQSIPMDWTYGYMIPDGLIFKLNPVPLKEMSPALIEKDRRFWDAYSADLLNDPAFATDTDAQTNFAKLAYWHSDLYRWWHLDHEEEAWLRIATRLCPRMPEAVNALTSLLVRNQRYDEAIATAESAIKADPVSEQFPAALEGLKNIRVFGEREVELKASLAKSPYDVGLNLELAKVLNDEGKFEEQKERLRLAATLGNWSHEAVTDVVNYYVDSVHNEDAAIAFLEERAKIDPKGSELIYNLAAMHAGQNHVEAALKYLEQAVNVGGATALQSAKVDGRFGAMHDDPRFVALMDRLANTVSTNAPPTSPTGVVGPPKPAKSGK